MNSNPKHKAKNLPMLEAIKSKVLNKNGREGIIRSGCHREGKESMTQEREMIIRQKRLKTETPRV